MNGKLIWRGMNGSEALRRIIASDRYEYIASGAGWFWLRTKWGDVVEVSINDNNIVADVQILGEEVAQ